MCNWLVLEGLPKRPLPGLRPVQLVAICEELREKAGDAIRNRSFDGLAAHKENMPAQLWEAVVFVQLRPPLHDKFWRYLQLFSDSVSDE
jgi:hypothetical protein